MIHLVGEGVGHASTPDRSSAHTSADDVGDRVARDPRPYKNIAFDERPPIRKFTYISIYSYLLCIEVFNVLELRAQRCVTPNATSW